MPKVIRKENKRRIGKGVFATFISIFIFSSLFYIFLTPGNTSTKVDKILNPISQIITRLINPIGAIAQTDLLDKGENYAVVIKNLKTGETYSLNKDEDFSSASLYKLWVLAVAESQIKGGALKTDEILSAKKDDLDRELEDLSNDISPTPTEEANEESNQAPTVISYKVSDAIDQMIEVSDNYAALLLVQRLSEKNVDDFLAQNGFSESGFGSPPTTSAQDISSYFEKLYKGGFVNSSVMLSILKQQQINDRIPKYLPTGIVVAHKTGELDGNKHNGGIVFARKGDYIIVLMSNTSDPDSAAENEAIFSHDVYNYFQNKK